MEDLEIRKFAQFDNIYQDKVVLITGHTGFKGSWLALWLQNLGAKLVGYSLAPPTNPNHYDLLNLKINSIIGDIRDRERLDKIFREFKPDIVFHLAAQPLVRHSYLDPYETYTTNVIGTLNIFDMSKKYEVKAIVNVTSDKCYENKEWVYGYRENDPMGGFDPYSSSKGCAELLTNSYRNSFFNLSEYNITHKTLLASCRAGNVIGGGDWAQDRLLTDIVTATTKNEKVKIRNPHAIRPWQYVLEPLSGYLLVGQKLLEGKKEYATAWNFGPMDENMITVLEVLKKSKEHWDKIDYQIDKSYHPYESKILKLDCSKASFYLKWKSVWDIDTSIEKTIQWYKNFYEKKSIMTLIHLKEYVYSAKEKSLIWVR